ncbi:MAG: sulfatase-like hydrolase/transferase [Oceanospirillaceae bacterium]|nr:sulfatase-like hydrolase/transferase [Oceanospirillaceae bacterium]
MRMNIIFSAIVFLVFNIPGIVLQISHIMNSSDSNKLSSILATNVFFSSPLPLYLSQFLIVSLLSISLFILSQAYFSVKFSRIVHQHIRSELFAKILWLCISNAALLILNAAYFQHSSHLTSLFRMWPEHHLNILLCWVIILLPILYYFWATRINRLTQFNVGILLVVTVSFYISAEEQHHTNLVNDDSNASLKPNIIIIGVDSLRSDLFQSHMPFLTEQLKQSIIFEHALTPLGRTFPAWNTILSGLYPINHGARINLIGNNHLVNRKQFLPSILNQHGYRTIFAIDETRFANIGEHQGFQQTITPRTGASDFIISSIADQPLLNVLSLVPQSRWLLPEIYANRGAAKTYRPDAFNKIIERDLPPANEPTLFAVHFCLAHWPYYFSTKDQPDFSYPEPYYPTNLTAADKQLESLFKTLENKGYLKNSRIVFLSDHGEAWTHESPSFSNINNEDDIYHLQEYGHGSSLTSNSNHVLVALKDFSKQESLYQNILKTTSLADITPTIISELNIATNQTFDGLSLSNKQLPKDRFIPIETGTILQVDESNKLNIDEIVKEFLDRYELNSNGLLTIQDPKIEAGLKAKGYGLRNQTEILKVFKDSQFKLFNKKYSTFESFVTFDELANKYSNWAEAWCRYYKNERQECKG